MVHDAQMGNLILWGIVIIALLLFIIVVALLTAGAKAGNVVNDVNQAGGVLKQGVMAALPQIETAVNRINPQLGSLIAQAVPRLLKVRQ